MLSLLPLRAEADAKETEKMKPTWTKVYTGHWYPEDPARAERRMEFWADAMWENMGQPFEFPPTATPPQRSMGGFECEMSPMRTVDLQAIPWPDALVREMYGEAIDRFNEMAAAGKIMIIENFEPI
jgi:hypothetical protein